MPIYEYRCTQCDTHFELLVRSDTHAACPQCRSEALARQVSRIAPASATARRIADGRRQAVKEGHFSHYSAAERAKASR
ncbi:MAG: zinc ribbon domain-containing protein [Rhodocyclaceae bacterium]